MISEVSQDARGYDPYNSAERPHVAMATNAKHARTDALMRRAFKYLENHPQIAAERLARSLAVAREMKRCGAVRIDRDTFMFSGEKIPPI